MDAATDSPTTLVLTAQERNDLAAMARRYLQVSATPPPRSDETIRCRVLALRLTQDA
jgi:hypothetical protein